MPENNEINENEITAEAVAEEVPQNEVLTGETETAEAPVTDKETKAEKRTRDRESLKNEMYEAENPGALGFFKLFFIGLLGGIVGAFPFAVLLCAFDIFSIPLMIACGAGVTSFYFAIGHGKYKGARTHVIIVLDTLLATVISFVVTVLIHYVPKFAEVYPDKNPFEILMHYFFVYAPGHLDSVQGGSIVTNEGGFNGYTVLAVALVLSLIGAYGVLIWLKIYKKRADKAKAREE
ncbi:MAG: hypothetical protein K6B54_02390 [Clostridia bacterium]|nr:hypothetical protein [Clostridia bacterium]